MYKRFNCLIFIFSVLLNGCTNNKCSFDTTLNNKGNDTQDTECFCLSATNEENQPSSEEQVEKKAEIVFIYEGALFDGYLNQRFFEDAKEYAEANEKTFTYLQSPSEDYNGYFETYNHAVKMGAKIIITTCNYLDVVEEISKKNPSIKFVVIKHDAVPFYRIGDPFDPIIEWNNYEAKENFTYVNWNDYESAYIAGYLAVKEGFKNIGAALDASLIYNKFGYYYIQGINDAAKDIEGVMCKITNRYTEDYSGEYLSKIFNWYSTGTDVVYACGSSISFDLVKAAAEAVYKSSIIGAFGDKYNLSNRVITSTIMNSDSCKTPVKNILEQFYNNEWDRVLNKQKIEVDAKENAGGIAYHKDRISKFTENDYSALLQDFRDDKIKIDDDGFVERLVVLLHSGFSVSGAWEELNSKLSNVSIIYDER